MPRHVDKRRQRCQQRHRRIYANQLGCSASCPGTQAVCRRVFPSEFQQRGLVGHFGQTGEWQINLIAGMMGLRR